MSVLETGEVTELEYQLNQVAIIHVCQVCRKIFDSSAAVTQHNWKYHQIGGAGGVDVQL